MKVWLAKSKNGEILLYNTAPHKVGDFWQGQPPLITKDVLPKGVSPKWEDKEPIQVEIELHTLNS